MPNKSPRLRPHNFKSEIVFRGFVFEAGGALASYNVQANATQGRRVVSSFVFCIPTQSGAPVQVAHLRKLAYLRKCVYLRKVPYLPKVANLWKVRREFNFAEGI